MTTQTVTDIRTPIWEVNCKCSDCILNPESSHGIYTIGAYKVPKVLSLRRSTAGDQAVEQHFRTGCDRYSKRLPFEGARNDDPRVIVY
jgi:hypothetical protein